MINADGAGEKYSFNYNASKEEYYFATTDGSGRIAERWYNNYGWEARLDLDGETQFTAEVILSSALINGSEYLILERIG
jgi:hypothetical protein